MRPSIFRLQILVCAAFLTSCGSSSRNDVPQRIDSASALAAVRAATPISINPEVAAEAFALNSTATDLQRDELEQALVGSVVEWDIPIYEIDLEEGVYRITSQPFGIQSKEAIPLLRVLALLHATSDADKKLLRAAKTNDVLRLRARVREIRLRTIMILEQGVLVPIASEESAVLPKSSDEASASGVEIPR